MLGRIGEDYDLLKKKVIRECDEQVADAVRDHFKQLEKVAEEFSGF
jgi:hypothetical protein